MIDRVVNGVVTTTSVGVNSRLKSKCARSAFTLHLELRSAGLVMDTRCLLLTLHSCYA